MDFSQRESNQPAQHHAQATHASAQTASSGSSSKSRRYGQAGWMSFLNVVILFSCTVVLLALLVSLMVSKSPSNDLGKSVNTNENQAVFLNGGQVYFGHITAINDKYLRLNDIYYLQVSQTVQPNGTQAAGNPTLVALGCELHRPANQMIINQSQVMFWENLKNETDANTVPGAIKKDVTDNPNGHTCATSTPSSSSGSSSAPAPTKK